MDSASIKAWIENHISNNVDLRREMCAHAMKWDAKLWKRTSKRVIKHCDEFSWMAECPMEFVGASNLFLEKCVVRYFDNFGDGGEAQILVITDPTDSKVLTWAFNID